MALLTQALEDADATTGAKASETETAAGAETTARTKEHDAGASSEAPETPALAGTTASTSTADTKAEGDDVEETASRGRAEHSASPCESSLVAVEDESASLVMLPGTATAAETPLVVRTHSSGDGGRGALGREDSAALLDLPDDHGGMVRTTSCMSRCNWAFFFRV